MTDIITSNISSKGKKKIARKWKLETNQSREKKLHQQGQRWEIGGGENIWTELFESWKFYKNYIKQITCWCEVAGWNISWTFSGTMESLWWRHCEEYRDMEIRERTKMSTGRIILKCLRLVYGNKETWKRKK